MNQAQEGDLAAVHALRKEGASLDLVNQKGVTALMLASWKGHLEIVDYLYKEGADLNVRDLSGTTALMLVRERESCVVTTSSICHEDQDDI